MHASKLKLTVWFWAAYLMATHSNGIAALQLQGQLGLGSYKSAWLLAAKLRRAMVAPGRALLAGLVEVDETTIARTNRPAGTGAATRARCLPLPPRHRRRQNAHHLQHADQAGSNGISLTCRSPSNAVLLAKRAQSATPTKSELPSVRRR